MRRASVVLSLLVAIVICPRFAADDKTDKKDPKERIAERLQDLSLTDEQEANIAKIEKESQPKIEEAAKELRTVAMEEMDKIRAVLTPEQKQKLQQLKDERREHRLEGLAQRIANLKDLDLSEEELAKFEEIRNTYRPRIEKALEGFTGILTAEQKKAREDALEAGKKRSEIVKSLNLTDEQKEKMQTAGKELRTVVHEEMEKLCDVLNEEQKSKIADVKEERRHRAHDHRARIVSNFEELNLTNEQKAKIADIRKEYRPKVHEAGNKLRAAIREEVESIRSVIKG
jgi:Spy/CpxP family protein refolding chaperone